MYEISENSTWHCQLILSPVCCDYLLTISARYTTGSAFETANILFFSCLEKSSRFVRTYPVYINAFQVPAQDLAPNPTMRKVQIPPNDEQLLAVLATNRKPALFPPCFPSLAPSKGGWSTQLSQESPLPHNLHLRTCSSNYFAATRAAPGQFRVRNRLYIQPSKHRSQLAKISSQLRVPILAPMHLHRSFQEHRRALHPPVCTASIKSREHETGKKNRFQIPAIRSDFHVRQKLIQRFDGPGIMIPG